VTCVSLECAEGGGGMACCKENPSWPEICSCFPLVSGTCEAKRTREETRQIFEQKMVPVVVHTTGLDSGTSAGEHSLK